MDALCALKPVTAPQIALFLLARRPLVRLSTAGAGSLPISFKNLLEGAKGTTLTAR